MKLALESGQTTLDTASILGVSGVPIDGAALLRDGLDATLGPLRERGLAPSQIGAFFFNPLDPDPATRADALTRIRRLIPLAAEAGCGWIAFAGGSRAKDIFGGAAPANLHAAALEDAVAALAAIAEDAGRHGVRLSLEPHIRSVIATPERAAELCARVASPALRITFDVTSFYDFLDLLDPALMLARAEAALASCCGLVHFKEVAPVPGFHLHAGLAPMGSGPTDWRAVLAAAARIAPLDAWLLVEHCGSADEARASVAMVRQAAADLGLVLG